MESSAEFLYPFGTICYLIGLSLYGLELCDYSSGMTPARSSASGLVGPVVDVVQSVHNGEVKC